MIHPAPASPADPLDLDADPLAFIPAPSATGRHDGWTPHRQRQFVRALAVVGVVDRAAKMVGISPSAAYQLRKRAGAESFAEAWDTALQMGRDRAFDIAMDRAINGYERPRYYAGRQVGVIRTFDHRTVMAALAPPRPLPTRRKGPRE